MATDSTKYAAHSDTETRHSALEELYRDERRPALLLLSGLVIAVIFFALGIMVGHWIGTDAARTRVSQQPEQTSRTTSPPSPPAADNNTAPSVQTNQTNMNAAPRPSPSPREMERRYTLLIATYNAPEDAQPLIKRLEQAGYKDVRTSTPRASDRQQKFSVLLGRYTRDEADQLASRMRASGDARLRNVRVVEDPSN